MDIPAATAAGIMVVNAPTSNIISAAELTVGHILGLLRNISQANASLRAGEWKRSAYTGTELYEKKVGIIGLGRIGGLVAERLAPFGTELLAYDPFVTAPRAASLGVRLTDLETLLAEAELEVPNVAQARLSAAPRDGAYSEYRGYILAEMQWLARQHPGATW